MSSKSDWATKKDLVSKYICNSKHKVHAFKVCNLVSFSMLTELCMSILLLLLFFKKPTML